MHLFLHRPHVQPERLLHHICRNIKFHPVDVPLLLAVPRCFSRLPSPTAFTALLHHRICILRRRFPALNTQGNRQNKKDHQLCPDHCCRSRMLFFPHGTLSFPHTSQCMRTGRELCHETYISPRRIFKTSSTASFTYSPIEISLHPTTKCWQRFTGIRTFWARL